MSEIEFRYDENDCVFCAKVEQIIAEHYRGDHRVVLDFEPLNPVTPGHRLFVPRMHVADAADIPEVTGLVMERASMHARTQGEPFNLITSAGEAATQSVYHLHIHYVPRYAKDGLHLPWTGQKERDV